MKTPSLKLVAVGAACLALGAAGTAGAGTLITGKDIKDGSIAAKDLSKKARTALKGAKGPRGATGLRGAQGPAGQNGAPGGPGTSGSTAPALMMGSVAPDPGSTVFAPPSGGNQSGSESGAQVPVPPGEPLVARDFAVRATAAPGAGQSFTVTLRLDGANTGLGCTIAGASTTCAPAGTTVLDLPASGLLSVRATASAGATPARLGWGFRVVF